MSIADYGWSASRASIATGFQPARVLRASGRQAFLITDSGEWSAPSTQWLLPGDWVEFDPARQRAGSILPRRGVIERKLPGRAAVSQPIAANVDLALIVQGLDGDFNPRRLERCLLMAAACEVRAAIVLNKADLLPPGEPERLAAEVRRRTGAEVVAVSALTPAGLDELHALARPRETAVLLGSSGAGKSTLTNALLGGQRQQTAPVRASDCRGRHTTTGRELFLLPAGWMLIDTPGLREVEAWAADEAIGEVFDDITAAAARCRFRDCRHQDEPGCAVREAEAAGEIDQDRLEHYRKLTAEVSAQESKRRGRIGARAIRQFNKMRDRGWDFSE